MIIPYLASLSTHAWLRMMYNEATNNYNNNNSNSQIYCSLMSKYKNNKQENKQSLQFLLVQLQIVDY